MRDIKFRGKRYDNEECVVGDLLHQNDGRIEICTHIGTWRENPDDVDAYGEEFVVNPDTVCQFTGLHDKNGKEIYEGDIIELIDLTDNLKAVVVYSEEETAFLLNIIGSNAIGTRTLGNWLSLGYEYVIIGNIHDNPKL